jgi:hypothetical protein
MIIGNWEYEITEKESSYDIIIKSISDNKSLKISDIVFPIEREDWLEEVYRTAKETLDGQPHCCYDGKCEWVIS